MNNPKNSKKSTTCDSYTPICDFVARYAQSGSLRLHMPGHKGKPLIGPESLDITEIDGADVLYHANGIIRKSEDNAARLFGTAKTFYSAEGSSLCIRAMLCLARLYAASTGRPSAIIAARNVHKTFVTAAALMDIDVRWLYSREDSALSCKIDFAELEKMLAALRPAAVYVTCPDYLGNLADISALAGLCHKYGSILMVDNAHGAYLKFLSSPAHPIDLGADIVCDSAHKTLPALTGAAYLHISRSAPEFFSEHAENALSVFASTSPSYLILQSLDAVNGLLFEGLPGRIRTSAARAESLKKRLSRHGYTLVSDEPLKLTISPKPFGYTGTELAGILRESGIVCEFSDPDYAVMMFSCETDEDDYNRLEAALLAIPRAQPIAVRPPKPMRMESALTPNAAIMSPSEWIPCAQAEGRILAGASVSCPPAVPIAVLGERINKSCVELFKYYGIEKCLVVRE